MCDLSMLFTAFTSIWTPHVTKTDVLLSLARSPSTPCSLIGLVSVNNLLSYWFSAWQDPVLLLAHNVPAWSEKPEEWCLVLWQVKTKFLWSVQGWFVHVMLVKVKGKNRKNSATQAASHTRKHLHTHTPSHTHFHTHTPSHTNTFTEHSPLISHTATSENGSWLAGLVCSPWSTVMSQIISGFCLCSCFSLNFIGTIWDLGICSNALKWHVVWEKKDLVCRPILSAAFPSQTFQPTKWRRLNWTTVLQRAQIKFNQVTQAKPSGLNDARRECCGQTKLLEDRMNQNFSVHGYSL